MVVAVESTTDSTGNGTGLHYIMTQCAGSSSSRLNNRLDGGGTGLHYVMTQYGVSSRIDNRLDR